MLFYLAAPRVGKVGVGYFPFLSSLTVKGGGVTGQRLAFCAKVCRTVKADLLGDDLKRLVGREKETDRPLDAATDEQTMDRLAGIALDGATEVCGVVTEYGGDRLV